MVVLELAAVIIGVSVIVWGAESFAAHLAGAAKRLKVTSFALALLLAGAEPEELATAVTGTLRHSPAIALGDVIGANAAICLVALGVGAVIEKSFQNGRAVLSELTVPIESLGVVERFDDDKIILAQKIAAT